MATRGRESTPGKEKRGTSPSFPLRSNMTQQRILNASTPSFTDRKHDPTAMEKHVPNYLKPTMSSGVDVTKQPGKKQASSDKAKRPNLMRTRSLDMPPPFRAQKPQISSVSALRSSSFSAKTGTAQKPIADKLLKGTKDAGKQHTLYSRTASAEKKSSTNSKTGPPVRVADTPDVSDIPQLETQQDKQEYRVIEAEQEITHTGSINDTGAEISVSRNMEPTNLRQAQLKSHKDEELVTIECSTVSEHQDVLPDFKISKPEDELLTEGIISNQQELDDHHSTTTNGSVTSNLKVEDEEMEGGKEASDKKEEVTIEGETIDSEGSKMQEAEEVKQKAEDEALKPQGAGGKKDSVVSNDVIEETASKLREHRRNKVKTLAGALKLSFHYKSQRENNLQHSYSTV